MGIYSKLTNNIFINNILIALRLDAKKELSVGQWKSFKYNNSKSIQQNAGFSNSIEVDEALGKVKNKLIDSLKTYVSKDSKVLDFGCGPGIYMKIISENYDVSGVDISEEMLTKAHELLPNNKFYLGNFFNVKFDDKFQAIYSISTLEYIPVSLIDYFFKKCSDIMNKDGLLFIQYPHALRKLDLHYPDRNYINYSPEFISKVASNYFTIIENNQCFDSRLTCKYDNNPYPTSSKVFKNGYLLIATKK